jgi:hypothetical protein
MTAVEAPYWLRVSMLRNVGLLMVAAALSQKNTPNGSAPRFGSLSFTHGADDLGSVAVSHA